MAVVAKMEGEQTLSTLEALWTLIQCQKKSVQHALAKRLNASIEAEKAAKVKMTEEEFYEKLDKSLESASSRHVYTMEVNESGEDFINRILSESE